MQQCNGGDHLAPFSGASGSGRPFPPPATLEGDRDDGGGDVQNKDAISSFFKKTFFVFAQRRINK